MEAITGNFLQQYAFHGSNSVGSCIYFGDLDTNTILRYYDLITGDLGGIELGVDHFGMLVCTASYGRYLFVIYLEGYVIIDCDHQCIYDISRYSSGFAGVHGFLGRGHTGPLFSGIKSDEYCCYDINSRAWVTNHKSGHMIVRDELSDVCVEFDHEFENIPSYVCYNSHPLVSHAYKVRIGKTIKWYRSQLLSINQYDRSLYFQNQSYLLKVDYESGNILDQYELPNEYNYLNLVYGSMVWVNSDYAFIRVGAKCANFRPSTRSMDSVDGLVLSHCVVPNCGVLLVLKSKEMIRCYDVDAYFNSVLTSRLRGIVEDDKMIGKIHL